MMDDMGYCKFTEVQLVPSVVKAMLCRRWWSWSNLCFFIGSIFYVIDSIWDIVSAAKGQSDDDDDDYDDDNCGDDCDDDSSSYDDVSSWVADLDWYKIIGVLGALFYLLEGLVDIYDTWRTQPSDGRKTDILPVWGRYGIYTIFAVAASFDLLGSLFDDSSTSLGAVASHGYLLQAVLSVIFFPNSDYGDDDSYYSSDENEEDNSSDEASSTSSSSSSSSLSTQEEEQWKRIKCIVKTGDFLFVLGSLIDVIISYMDLDGMEQSNAIQMLVWGLVSSLLWFMDAICYLMADAAEYNIYYQYESTSSLLSSSIHTTVLSEEGTAEIPHDMYDYVLLEESNESASNENLDDDSRAEDLK